METEIDNALVFNAQPNCGYETQRIEYKCVVLQIVGLTWRHVSSNR
jgi:hypothetical protein